METDNSQSKKLFVIDAYALIYRSYFAFIRNPRFNSKGLNTSAILGFVNSLEQVLNNEKPSHIAVAFDVHAETFRHKMFDQYKANRDEMPEDIRLAVPIIRNIVKAYNIPIIEKAGFEADDVIGTIALKAENEGFTTYMMTPDKDYAQLVDSNTFMYKPPKNGNNPEIWGIDEVNENFQIDQPSQVIEILGLMGDSADNIPGCPGVGPKTAMKLIGDYKSIEGIYQNIDKLKGKLKENLIEHKEQVFLSRELVIINTKVPIDIDFEEMKIAEPDKDQLMALFQELEFRTLASKLNSAQPITVKTSNSTPGLPTQGSLFGSDEIQTVASSINYESIETTKHQYIKIENASQRASLRAELAVSSSFCFDTETTGIDPHISDLVCMSFAIKPHQAFCVLLPNDRTETIKILDEFRLIFEDENIEKIGQNIKYDMLMLKQYGINVKGKLFDTMIAHYLLQPELRHNLDYLCEQYLNYKKVATEELIGAKGKNQRTMRSVETDTLVKYACEDADLTLQLKNKLATELTNNELSDLFNNIEMPLVHVLTEMEASGVKIDPDALNEYAVSLKEQIIQLEKEIHELAGVDFLISSPKQLGEILFDRLKIDPNAKKTKTKQYSTGEEVLEKLADKHPIINKVLEFRGLKKLLNTYVEALPKLINQRSGKIHTSFNQAIASTGRLSSTNPNLQNIPIRDDNGREIRKAFIPTEPGMLYLSADYSQIELRIMAALSKDPNMIEAFANNIDIHAATASKIFKS
ncbi:MAG TPA: DNA polymerase I [Prolixibacteraceae bacterium]|nr:DNA polymerase I [Prolixibacteraceae bacterium]